MNFLESMKDAGTNIDSGTDGASADLWVKIGGKEWFITIRKSKSQIVKESKEKHGA